MNSSAPIVVFDLGDEEVSAGMNEDQVNLEPVKDRYSDRRGFNRIMRYDHEQRGISLQKDGRQPRSCRGVPRPTLFSFSCQTSVWQYSP